METTLKELSRNVKMRLNGNATCAYDKQDEWQQQRTDLGRAYSLTLFYKGRRMTVDFWDSADGPGMNFNVDRADDDGTAEVLECLLSDASGVVAEYGGGSFEEFCSEFGYDVDSRKAFATYQQCKRQTEKLRKMLGEDFGKFMQAERG